MIFQASCQKMYKNFDLGVFYRESTKTTNTNNMGKDLKDLVIDLAINHKVMVSASIDTIKDIKDSNNSFNVESILIINKTIEREPVEEILNNNFKIYNAYGSTVIGNYVCMSFKRVLKNNN